MTTEEFVKWIYPAAKRLGEINPLFVTAQAALESGWGKSAIGNNLFGITKGSWTGAVELVTTTEYFSTPDKSFKAPEKVLSVTKIGDRYRYKVERLFRQYDTVEDCLRDHLLILKKPGYADAWLYRNDPFKYAEMIVNETGAKYATAPNYAAVMADMIRSVERRVKQLGL